MKAATTATAPTQAARRTRRGRTTSTAPRGGVRPGPAGWACRRRCGPGAPARRSSRGGRRRRGGGRRAQRAQRVRGHQRGDAGLGALVLLGPGHAGALHGLRVGVAGQHPVADRRALVEGYPRQAGRHGVAHVLEVRGPAADHHAEGDDGVVDCGPVPGTPPAARSCRGPARRWAARHRPCRPRPAPARGARRRSRRATASPPRPGAGRSRRAPPGLDVRRRS